MTYFKYLPLLCLLLTPFISAHAAENKDVLNHYRVTRSDYTFSTVFDMATEKKSVGSVIKSVFHLTTHYDSYDHFGLYEGTGICRLLCLGAFYVWATEIDLYNETGERAGMIDGQVVSSEPAKFSFYDANGHRIAIGYLDQNCLGFSLVDPHNSALILARLTRNFILDTVDNWDVVIYHPELISPHFVKIFAAFVCDTQTKFKPDF